jgi:hypothetical protein
LLLYSPYLQLGKKLDAKDEAIQRARKDIELKLNDIESLKTKHDAAIVNITTSYTKEIGLLKEQLAKNESELEGVRRCLIHICFFNISRQIDIIM